MLSKQKPLIARFALAASISMLFLAPGLASASTSGFSAVASPSSHAPSSDLTVTVTITNTTGNDLTRLDVGFDAVGLNYISTDCGSPNNGDGVVTVEPLSPGSSACVFHVDASTPGTYDVGVHSKFGATYASEAPLHIVITSGGGSGGAISPFVSGLSSATTGYFSSLLALAPLIGVGIIVSIGFIWLKDVIGGLNEGKPLKMAHKARWDDGIDGIKSGKYHG
jgi:hypothetical protein